MRTDSQENSSRYIKPLIYDIQWHRVDLLIVQRATFREFSQDCIIHKLKRTVSMEISFRNSTDRFPQLLSKQPGRKDFKA
jgi:hypothetical protein